MLADLGKWAMVAGIVLLLGGALVWALGQFTGLGRLPGDFVWRRGGTTVYFPLATSIILSLLLTLLLNLLLRQR